MPSPFRPASPAPPALATQQDDVGTFSPLSSSASAAVIHGSNITSSSSVQTPAFLSSYQSFFRYLHTETHVSHQAETSTIIPLPSLYDPILECLRAGQWNGYVQYKESKERSSIVREEMRNRDEGQQGP